MTQELLAKNERLMKTVINRVNEMLLNTKINAFYQSFKTESETQDWIFKAALATLVIPIQDRKLA